MDIPSNRRPGRGPQKYSYALRCVACPIPANTARLALLMAVAERLHGFVESVAADPRG